MKDGKFYLDLDAFDTTLGVVKFGKKEHAIEQPDAATFARLIMIAAELEQFQDLDMEGMDSEGVHDTVAGLADTMGGAISSVMPTLQVDKLKFGPLLLLFRTVYKVLMTFDPTAGMFEEGSQSGEPDGSEPAPGSADSTAE